MRYAIAYHPKCKKEIHKLCNKNPVLEKILKKKMEEIVQNSHHYKPLRYEFSGERRVHIMKNFVLKFIIDDKSKTVKFIAFEHPDTVYVR